MCHEFCSVLCCNMFWPFDCFCLLTLSSGKGPWLKLNISIFLNQIFWHFWLSPCFALIWVWGIHDLVRMPYMQTRRHGVVCAISSIHCICWCSFQSSRGICGPQKPGVCGGSAGESSQPTAGVDRLQPRPDGSVGPGSSVCHSALLGHTGIFLCWYQSLGFLSYTLQPCYNSIFFFLELLPITNQVRVLRL